ncbi:MAG: HNH endonuclease [Podoviridae sp. ctbj_2]|nr:MAG: HNH endonuclease [Podoviridae sp. ctbj_2]
MKVNSKGYPYTNFYYEGRPHCHLAHTFVWRAFNGDIPEGFEVDHIDNDRMNFKLENLQLLSKSQNNQKAYDSGNRMFVFGDTNPNSLKRKTSVYVQ